MWWFSMRLKAGELKSGTSKSVFLVNKCKLIFTSKKNVQNLFFLQFHGFSELRSWNSKLKIEFLKLDTLHLETNPMPCINNCSRQQASTLPYGTWPHKFNKIVPKCTGQMHWQWWWLWSHRIIQPRLKGFYEPDSGETKVTTFSLILDTKAVSGSGKTPYTTMPA